MDRGAQIQETGAELRRQLLEGLRALEKAVTMVRVSYQKMDAHLHSRDAARAATAESGPVAGDHAAGPQFVKGQHDLSGGGLKVKAFVKARESAGGSSGQDNAAYAKRPDREIHIDRRL